MSEVTLHTVHPKPRFAPISVKRVRGEVIEMCSGSEEGTYSRPTHSCITELQASK